MLHRTRVYKKTTLLCVGLAASLCGVAISKFLMRGIPSWYCLFAAIFLLAALRHRHALSVVAVLLLGFGVGLWRGGNFLKLITPYQDLSGKKVTVLVKADSSAVYGKNKQMEFDASHVMIVAPYRVTLPGRMLITGYGSNSLLRGDTVQVSGKLYARRGGKQAGISYGEIQVLARSSSLLERLRRNFLTGLATALPEPHDQFAAGLLIGQRSELPTNVTTTLQIVGLSHVIAVSGYNLTILAEVARRKLGKKSKFRSTVISIGLILLFVGLAGSSSSIARAAFVSLLTVVAAHYGRSVQPLLLILLAAAYTTLSNPLNLWTDIGWYLSFLAFFGVLIIAPAVQKRFLGNKKEPNTVVLLVIETSSAQVMTIPIIMYIFGQVSMVSLMSNILVVPLVPLAMLLSVVAGLGGMIAPAVAGVLAWPARMLLGFMLGVCSLLSRIPHAMSSLQIGVVVMCSMYAALVIVVIVMRKKASKYDKIVLE